VDEEIRNALALAPEDVEFFERLRQAVIRANRRMNLTRLTEPRDFYTKHILDSLLPFRVVPALRELEPRQRVADLGSGAGFPGLVVARLHPEWEVVLIERTRKKALFLEETHEELGLENVYVVPLDAREAAGRVRLLRRGCDLVLARAVGRVAAVSRSAAPLLRRGGLLVHYKGGRPDRKEIEEGRAAAADLGLTQGDPVVYDLPPDARRSVILSRASGRRRSAGRPRRRASRKSRGDRGR
jgi:16S rRNA (guanine527-N7)-methyltransferase